MCVIQYMSDKLVSDSHEHFALSSAKILLAQHSERKKKIKQADRHNHTQTLARKKRKRRINEATIKASEENVCNEIKVCIISKRKEMNEKNRSVKITHTHSTIYVSFDVCVCDVSSTKRH